MITGEYKVKKQKNGNVHNYTYYRCTKKRKDMKCSEPYIRQEELDKRLSSLLQKFSLRPDWAAGLRAMLEKDKKEAAQSSTAFVQEAGERIRAIQTKLQRLLDGYLEQDIEREIYRLEKAKLLSEKKSLEEQMARIEQKRTGWLEPMAEWIKEAENLPKIAQERTSFWPTARRACARRAARIHRGKINGRHFAPPTIWLSKSRPVLSWCPRRDSNPQP